MEMTVKTTTHAAARLAQRAFSRSDIDLILRCGTEVGGGYYVCEKDIERLKLEQIQELGRAKCLQGARVVLEGDHLITAYYAQPAKARRLLQNAEERSLNTPRSRRLGHVNR